MTYVLGCMPEHLYHLYLFKGVTEEAEDLAVVSLESLDLLPCEHLDQEYVPSTRHTQHWVESGGVRGDGELAGLLR